LQEVWCRLLVAARRPDCRFRGATDIEATVYLRRVAIRVLVDRTRRERAGKRGGGLRALALPASAADWLPAPAGEQPDARLKSQERRRLFRRRCRELLGRRASPRSVRVAELALLDGLSSAEIARRPGVRIRECGVNSIVYRLRRRLAATGERLPRRSTRSRG
jgi:DNA-directed RNA polymerase specialized sigma24 family protein